MGKEKYLNVLIITGLILFVISVPYLVSDIDFIYESEVLYEKLNSKINSDVGAVTATQKPKPTATPKPVKKGDTIKGTIMDICDEYIVVEIMDTNEQIKFVINEDSVFYTYNGSNDMHQLDNWDALQVGTKVEVILGKYFETQEYDGFYVDRIGILYTWFY